MCEDTSTTRGGPEELRGGKEEIGCRKEIKGSSCNGKEGGHGGEKRKRKKN